MMRTFKSLFVLCTALVLASILSAFGGNSGFPSATSAFELQSLRYGCTATIYLGGKDLRSSLVIETNGGCANPSFASNSSNDVLVLNCLVSVLGNLPLTIKSATREVIYGTTLSAPKHQVSILTIKDSFTLELGSAIAPITVKKSGQLDFIDLESNKGLSNAWAMVAMASTNVFSSAESEFSVNLVDDSFLDYKNAADPGCAVFCTVVQGMGAVDSIVAMPTGLFNGSTGVPLTEIIIAMALQSK